MLGKFRPKATAKSAHTGGKSLLSNKLVLNKRNGLIFIAMFAVVGASLLVISRAATSPTAFEPETGTLAAGATSVANANASGGRVLAFAGAATPTPTQTPTPAPTPTPGAMGTPEWRGDYQTGNFSQWPSREFKDGATAADMARQQQIATTFNVGGVTVPARTSFPYMAKFQVTRTDQTTGDPGRNRSEVTDYGEIFPRAEGSTKWWAWSMWLPPGFHVDTNAESPGGNGWLIFAQWHSDIGSPPIDFGFDKPANHIPHLLIGTKSDSRDRVMSGAYPLGVWNDFRVGITFGTSTSTGHLTVKMRSNYGSWVTLVNESSATLDSSRVANFKQGVYRATSTRTDDFIFTGTRRGPTEASISY